MECKISPLLNLSEGLVDGRSRSRRHAMMSLSKSVRNNTLDMEFIHTLFAQK